MRLQLGLILALLLQVLFVNNLVAEVLPLKNQTLTVNEKSGKLDGWYHDKSSKFEQLTTDLPEGVESALRVTPTEAQKFLGFFSQKIALDGKSGSYLFSAYVQTQTPGAALLEVKLFKDGKELKRIDSNQVSGSWQKVLLAFDTLTADSMQVLCRWKAGESQVGKTVDFADLKLMTCDKSLAIIGDSTVQDYSPKSDRRGWGQMLKPHFSPAIAVTNDAVGGRSTKTFIEEKRWEAVLAAKPDFVLIQFGHNDSHPKDQPESTDADSDYREYLIQYVKEARAIGALPIFVTPPHRRVFRDGKLAKHLDPYANQMRQVARELEVGVVDLYAMTKDKFESLGEEACTELFCSETDRSHFSEKGAKLLADYIAIQLPVVCPALVEYLESK
jgi:lysophospholipase L1-like esterase